jgi:preprotein translocase subunit SecG
MTILLTILHVIVCLVLILVVLAQQGKGQDLASAFGGGGSSAAFGARGAATFLAKVTTVAAILFMLTSLGLSYFRSAMGGGSVIPTTSAPAQTQPAAPEGTPATPGTETQPAQPGEEQSGEQPSGEATTPPAPSEGAAQPQTAPQPEQTPAAPQQP